MSANTGELIPFVFKGVSLKIRKKRQLAFSYGHQQAVQIRGIKVCSPKHFPEIFQLKHPNRSTRIS